MRCQDMPGSVSLGVAIACVTIAGIEIRYWQEYALNYSILDWPEALQAIGCVRLIGAWYLLYATLGVQIAPMAAIARFCKMDFYPIMRYRGMDGKGRS